MNDLINPDRYTFGESTHCTGADSTVPDHLASECPDTGCPFGNTEAERKLFLAQVTRSAEEYWMRLTKHHGYTAGDEPASIAGRFEDFIGYMMTLGDERGRLLPQTLADLITREGFTVERDKWPVIVTPDMVKDQPDYPAEAVASDEPDTKYGTCDVCDAVCETLHRSGTRWVCDRPTCNS